MENSHPETMQMPTRELRAIQGRLALLERQNYVLKLYGLAGLIVLAALLAPAVRGALRDSRSSVVTRDLIIQDSQGRKRAELSIDKDSQPELVLFGSGENSKASLSPILFEFTAESGPLSGATSTSLGSGGLFIFGDKKEVVGLGSSVGVAPFLHLFGSDKQQVWLSAGEDDGPALHMSDDAGFAVTLGKSSLETVRTGEKNTTSAASLVLFGKGGKVLWSVP